MMVEKFLYTNKIKKKVVFIALMGALMLFLSIFITYSSSDSHWSKRLWSNL